ncbi:MAG: hypothetical protein ACK42E_01920 [Candidatus Bipolaricaulaceae bacterium]
MQRLGLLAVSVVSALAIVATGKTLDIEIQPKWPDHHDQITLYLSGIWDTICTPRDPKVFRDGFTIVVKLAVPGGPCPRAQLSWRLQVPLGRLPRGRYEVLVQVEGPDGQVHTLGAAEFFVAQPEWLYWMSTRPLTFEDFKGQPPRQPGNAVGQICMDIDYEYKGSARSTPDGSALEVQLLEVRVWNRMDRNRSWILPDHKRPEVLEHEQIHFDINEVYRRLIQAELEKLARTLVLRVHGLDEARERLAQEVQKVFLRYYRKLQEVHDLFDADVEKGGLSTQKEWRRRVDRWLANPWEAPQP